jgi:signal transduction histidine kinase
VTISLKRHGPSFELKVADDGEGFGAVNPLAANAPGHIGLASMRERAELIGGGLEIESDGSGTEIRVTAPLE